MKPTLYFKKKENMEEYANNICGNSLI